MTMTYAQENRLVCTTHHLTGAEMERLLLRYDLPETARTILVAHEVEQGWWLFESYCERLSERGSATRHYSRQEAYHRANPLYGPSAPPSARLGWGDDEIPF